MSTIDAAHKRGLRRCTHAVGVAWAEVASARALGKVEGAGLLSGARGNGVLAFRHGQEQTRNGGACFLTPCGLVEQNWGDKRRALAF